MLYTVVPLERIYCNMNQSVKMIQDKNSLDITEKAEYKDITLTHGSLRARREGENYVVERIVSTDPSDYLKKEYSPGSYL